MTFRTMVIWGIVFQILSLILNGFVGIKATSLLTFGMAGVLFGVLITEFFVMYIMRTFFNKKWCELMHKRLE